MPRDSNGNYTLPSGNPVTSGTVIESTWANPTMADVAAALQDSLSRTGQGGMQAPFRHADGNIGSPGISWANEPSSGQYRKATQEFWFTVGGQEVFGITAGGIALAPGKQPTNIASYIVISDTEPVNASKGTQWYKSNSGVLYMRYQNPDLSYTWVVSNALSGNDIPMTGLNTVLNNYATEAAAAAAGVPIGGAYRKDQFLVTRLT